MCLQHFWNALDSATGGSAYSLIPTLTHGVVLCLVVAGLVQGLSGDKLGLTSYILHAAILGCIGYSFNGIYGLDYPTGVPTANTLKIVGFFCIFVAWIDLVLTVMATKIAYMFGLYYFSISMMFLVIGLNLMQAFGTDSDQVKSGNDCTGVFCFIVAVLSAYVIIPVLTGYGFLK